MTAQEHNKTLGILFLVYFGLQILGLVIAIIFMVGFSGFIFSGMSGNDAFPVGIMVFALGFGLIFSILLMIPIGMAGFKMYKESQSARIWGIIASIVSLLSIP